MDREEFHPGDSAVVEIWFVVRDSLGEDFGIGKEFTFSEGRTPLGDGVVEEILQSESSPTATNL